MRTDFADTMPAPKRQGPASGEHRKPRIPTRWHSKLELVVIFVAAWVVGLATIRICNLLVHYFWG